MKTLLLGLALLVAAATAAHADEGLTTISNPGGGQVIYGPVQGSGESLQSAMLVVLRFIHKQVGDRPQVGRFMRARDNRSVATFFTVNEKQGNSVKPMSGIVIVSMPAGSQPAAAILYDDASRFRKTGAVLLQMLIDAWRTASKPVPADPSTEPEPLELTTDGDRSAAIGLPAGWRLIGVGHGRLTAEGPNGELIDRGVIYRKIHDEGIPRTGDLFEAFVAVSNQDRRQQRRPEGTYKVSHVEEVSHYKLEARAIVVAFEADLHDGKGARTGSARIAAVYPRGVPTWELSVDVSSIPTSVAAAEASTMLAINASFSQDGAVIRRETEIALHKKKGAAGHKKTTAAKDKEREAHQRAFEKHMDNMDRYSKSFQNYIFDREQVQDNDHHAHGTVSDGDADILVKSDPDRFQIVEQKDFVKGVDY